MVKYYYNYNDNKLLKGSIKLYLYSYFYSNRTLYASGNVVARYTYDTWGALLSSSGVLANINPLRYRGYYYDTDTGMYYLQSRYYDPSLKRFINADDAELIEYLTSNNTMGGNLYCYCNNNAVNYYDFNGYDAIWLQDTNGVYGAGHSGLLLQDKNKKWYYFYWGDYNCECILLSGFKFTHIDSMNKYLVDNGIYGKKTPIFQEKVSYSEHGRKKATVTYKIIGYKYDAFEKIKYFKGDFTISLSYAKTYAREYQKYFRESNGKNSKYNWRENNCCQVSARIMSYSNTKYKNNFSKIKHITIPNIMFNRMKRW